MGNNSSAPSSQTTAASSADAIPRNRPIPENFILLQGCTTLEEHEECIQNAIHITRELHGEDGLKAIGFEFRFVPCCPSHGAPDDINISALDTCVEINETNDGNSDDGGGSSSPRDQQGLLSGEEYTMPISSPEDTTPRMKKSSSVVSLFSHNSSINEQFANHCHSCATRLFHLGGQPLKPQLPDSASKSVSTNEQLVESLEGEKESDLEKSSAVEDCTAKSTEEERNSILSQANADDEGTPATSATMITVSNRKQFIADGEMYELVANLAQEAAQSHMCTAFDLEWVTVCNEHRLGETVRALVDKDHRLLLEEGENKVVLQELLMSGSGAEKEEKKDDSDADNTKQNDQQSSLSQQTQHHLPQHPTSLNKTKSTLLIATGRGKVRAGIFSRHHLLTAGIEVGTSWHCIREARMRKWGVAIIDPNSRGEGVGYETFKRSVSRLFLDTECANADQKQAPMEKSPIRDDNDTASLESNKSTPQSTSSLSSHSIYILAHSASGGQLVRHLREDPTLLPSIRAIAFTDSTHNVQWVKHDPGLKEFLQRENCVYLRSNDVRSSQSCVKVSSRGKDIWCDCVTCINNKKFAGMEAETDTFWQHRFGDIKTVWAGTADHALSNWAGHESIWDHFDEHASSDAGTNDRSDEDGSNGGVDETSF